MQSSQKPPKMAVAFAASGAKNTIPVASQIAITPGAASFVDGFPATTRTPISAGGVPPSGLDMNGVLFAITAIQRWQSAGGQNEFDTTFAASVGGYPKGAILISADRSTQWLSTVENNTTDPDSAQSVGWFSLASYGIATVALSNVNVTLTAAQYGKRVLLLTGTLTANVQVTFPLNQIPIIVVNNTSGAFTVACKTSGGAAVTVVRGGQEMFFGDGVNLIARLGNTPPPGDRTKRLATTEMFASEFPVVLEDDGYCKLPNGMIWQWGADGTTSGQGHIDFPVAFPNKCLRVLISINGDAVNSIHPVFASHVPTTTGCDIWGNPTENISVTYLAIGF